MSGGGLIYVYAVVDAAPEELGLGLKGEPLRAVAAGQVAAVVSAHECPPEPDEEELWRHEAVVERLMEDAVVLPLRFGTTVAEEAAVEALLRSREEEFVELLGAVRGAVELGVRAELPAAAPTPVPSGASEAAPSGTEYMRERGRALRRREQASEALHGSMSALSRRSLLLGPRVGPGFRGAYLVDADKVEAFAELVGQLGEELDIEVSCTGPWPPYTFVSGGPR
ncbi:MAG TPA: GvpL/GvpF family gas vesicle protein [Solirubrobacterales bacterium]|jgi:hypothetical protein